ncbi:MAG TPA: hypothetical protein VKM55_13130 [Candidatus Lokiarchaeia archaeon]|nr:hypothetical protein [Candidatus Lokiarchaeia archaeon]
MVKTTLVPEPVDAIKTLRDKALTVTPDKIGLSRLTANLEVWGVIMEMGYPEGLATLIVLADGTTSLYFGNGGGIIGGGDHDEVRSEARKFLAMANQALYEMQFTETLPYPLVGRVKFYCRTFDGVFAADAEEDELEENDDVLSTLFQEGNEVIALLRSIID